MQHTYADLKASWGGYRGYDLWFSQSLNNATLGSVTLYTQWVPAFQTLLEQEGGSLPRFYRRVATLAHLPQPERSAALTALGHGYD
jgi:predicted aminopeptidase